jgi:Domain of unknown function (DUF4180)
MLTVKPYKINKVNIAEVISQEIIIANIQDGLDLLGNLYYQNFDKIIIYEKNITPEFFDLKTGIAGEILQKFSNYRVRLAIVGDFTKYQNKSFKDFVFESNKLGQINFVETITEAVK